MATLADALRGFAPASGMQFPAAALGAVPPNAPGVPPLLTTADAWQSTGHAIGDWMRGQRDKSAAMGLWNDQTGLPTQAGLSDAARQMAQNFEGGIKAYHGSPHSFDQFRSEAIGTGEGAQAYGHGLYFAGNEGVARGYRDALAPGQALAVDGVPVSQLPESHQGVALWMERTGKSPEELIPIAQQRIIKARQDAASLGLDPDALIGEYQGTLDAATALKGAQISRIPSGHMYEADLNVDPKHLLDWDSPLGRHDDMTQAAFAKAGGLSDASSLPPRVLDMTGQKLYQGMASKIGPEAATQALNEAGIPGIKYLDAGSRGAGEGSSNYVMFDPANIEILRKYGLFGMLGGGAAAASQDQGQ